MSVKPTTKRTIPIMGQKYKILYYNTVKTDDAANVFGDTDKDKKRIRVDLSNCKTAALVKCTLLHECIHAVLAQSGLDNLLTDEVEEAIVRAIEHGLTPLVEFKPAMWRRIKPVTRLELEMDDD